MTDYIEPGPLSENESIRQEFLPNPHLQELMDLDFWTLWRLEFAPPMTKPTKRPYLPSGWPADITDKRSWQPYQTVKALRFDCAAPVHPNTPVSETGFSGLGFIFSSLHNYTGIDIDPPADGPTEAQLNVYKRLASYTEYSVSGKGIHILVKGSVPTGKRKEGIEVYSDGRFFTMTGNVLNPVPIADCQDHLDTLYEQMGGERCGKAGVQPDRPERLSDEALVANNPHIAALCNIDPATYAGDLSAADQDLCNRLAARSGNRAQVERRWLASRLGQRHKTQSRPDYRQRTIETAFDRVELPRVDWAGASSNGQQIPFGPASSSPQPGQQEAHPLLWDAGQWEGVEPKPQIEVVPGLILAGHVNSLYAPGGNYKTLLTHQLLTSVALGVPFLGRTVMNGNALMLHCEDDLNRLHKIQRLINQHHSRPLRELAGRLFFACRAGWFGNELAIFDKSGLMNVTKAYDELRQTIIDNKILVAAFDNLAHLFGGSENDRNQASSFLVLLERLAMETGAAIILIGHYNKGGQVSGSTAWLNQVRNVIVIEKEDGHSSKRIIRVEKSNYLKTGIWGEFEWQDGILIPMARTNDGSGLDDALADQAFLECLAAATQIRRNFSHINGSNYYGKFFPAMPEARGLTKAAFEAAFERLLSGGKIELDQPLWQRANRAWKYGIKCTNPPAPTPCTDPHRPLAEPRTNACTNPHAPTPLYTTYIKEGGPEGPLPPNDKEKGGPAMH